MNAEAVEEGAIEAAASSLTSIENLVAGWETVTNASAATVGKAEETDASFRSQLRAQSARPTVHSDDAIIAGLFKAGATRVRLEKNDTSSSVTVQGTSIAGNSIAAVVEGGTDSDIADAIAERKAPGVGLVGTTTVSGVNFSRTVTTALKVAVTIDTAHNFPSDGANQIRTALIDFVNGEWVAGEGQFETSGLGIGEVPNANQTSSSYPIRSRSSGK